MSANGGVNRPVLPSLTSLRFFAALAVVLHHTAAVSGNLAIMNFIGQIGWLGVSFFFILSGFVLMWSFDQRMSAPAYIMRRLTRIYPLHLAGLLASLYFYGMTHIPLGGYIGTVPGTIANFLLVHDWLPGRPNIRQAWNGVSWTLSCEFFFYILAPFTFPYMLKASHRRFSVLTVCVWIGLAAVIIVAQSKHWDRLLDFYQYNPLPRACEFFLGAMGAQRIKSGWRVRSIGASLVAMFAPVLLYFTCVPATSLCGDLMILLFVPGTFLLIMAMAGHDIDGAKIWTQKPLWIRLGDASFALYMIHALLLGLFAIGIHTILFRIFYLSVYCEWLCIGWFIFVAVGLSILVHDRFEYPVRRRLLQLWAPSATTLAKPC